MCPSSEDPGDNRVLEDGDHTAGPGHLLFWDCQHHEPLVVEKTREIGMLMAIGATRSNIRSIFLFECGILGLAGTGLGIMIGLVAVRAIGSIPIEVPGARQVTHIPLLINPGTFPPSLCWHCSLTIAAGVYPGIRASQLDPVEALKG